MPVYNYATLDDPAAAAGGRSTFAEGINDAGQIVGLFQDSLSRQHGFLLRQPSQQIATRSSIGDGRRLQCRTSS
jgi:hypothetical protein